MHSSNCGLEDAAGLGQNASIFVLHENEAANSCPDSGALLHEIEWLKIDETDLFAGKSLMPSKSLRLA
jgi:hypothetical protein